MSDYVLLLDRNICPACRVRRSFVSGPCHNCGNRIFTKPPENPEKYEEETGIRHWYAWNSIKGWMHRDHFMVPDAKPNHRAYQAPALPKDYGKTITPSEVVARRAKSKRVNLKEWQRRKPGFKKVYA